MEQSTETCKNHTAEMWQHIKKRSSWALAMYDASTKASSGTLVGHINDFGNFDECLNVEVSENFGSFRGQHCMVQSTYPETNKLLDKISWATCVPSSCRPSDVENILRATYNTVVSVDPLMCHIKHQVPFTLRELLAIGVISVFAVLVVLSTLYDLTVKTSEKKNLLLLSFSCHRNWKRLIDPSTAPDHTLYAVNGIRVLATWWFICLHVYQSAIDQSASINHLAFLKATTNWKHLFLTNGTLQMDINFVLSGLLLSYLYLRERELGKHFSLWRFYLYRYLRVTPAFSIIILVNATLFSRLGSGPIWDKNILGKQHDCWYYGWNMLLYIRNYTKPHTCLFQSWGLNVDMQMYFLSPLILIPLHRRPKAGLTMVTVGVIAGMLTVFFSAYIKRVPVYSFTNMNSQIVKDLFIQTHTRFTPFLIGLALGYLLHLHKRSEKLNQIILSKVTVTFGWILCILALIGAHVMVLPFIQFDYNYEPLYSSIIIAIKRPIWSLGVSWVIFACVAGYGGILNTFLSSDTFLLLSRLAYGTTAVHSTVVQSRAFSIKTNIYFSDIQQFTEFVTDILLSLFGGTLMALIVEIPIVNISKQLLDKRIEKKRFVMQYSIDETSTVNPSHESVLSDISGLYLQRNRIRYV